VHHPVFFGGGSRSWAFKYIRESPEKNNWNSTDFDSFSRRDVWPFFLNYVRGPALPLDYSLAHHQKIRISDFWELELVIIPSEAYSTVYASEYFGRSDSEKFLLL